MNARKISSLLLALVMLFTMIPTAAFAESGLTIGHKFTETDTSFFTDGFSSMLDRNSDGNNSIYVFAMDSNRNVKPIDSGSATVVNNNGSTDEHFITAQRLDSGMLYVSASMKKTPVGSYTVKFTVGGTEYSYGISFSEQTGSGGNPGSSFALKYSADGQNWMDYSTHGPAIQITKGYDIYFKLYKNGSQVSCEFSDSADMIQFMTMGDSTLVHVKNTVVASGMTQVTAKLTDNSTYGTISVRVVVPSDPVISDYAGAVVKEVTPDSGNVSFGAVTGELDTANSDAAFSAPNGELLFDTTGKTPGSYDAKVGGKLYTAVIFNEVGEGYTARIPVAPTAADPSAGAFSKSQGINILYYQNNSSQWATINESNSNTQAISWLNAGDQPQSFYVYNVKNGSLVSMESDSALLVHGAESDFAVSTITVEGATVYKFTPKYQVNGAYQYGRLGSIGDTVICIRDGIRAVEFSLMVNFNDYGTARENIGISQTEQDIANNNTGAMNSMPDVGMGIGQDLGVSTYYLVKTSGEPAKLDYVLYDEIDISTLHVKSSNPDFVVVDDFVVQAKDGKNAIGFNLKLKDKSKVNRSEIEISFCKKGESTVNTWYMLVYMTPTAEPTGDTVYVSTEAEFKEKYATMASGTIILKPKQDGSPYKMDIVHTSSVVGFVGEEGKEVIITGDPNSSGPIITVKTGGIPAKWGDIIIDGDGNPADGGATNGRTSRRDGVYCASGNLLMGNMLIRDCNVGFRRNGTGNVGSTRVFGTSFKNCVVGFNVDAPNTYLQDARIEKCAVGILHKTLNFSNMMMASSSYIRNNTLVDNTTDIHLETSQNINFAQNYFGHNGEGDEPVVETASSFTNSIIYAPFYTDEAKTTLKATLAGAASPSGGTVDIAVDLTKLNENMSLVSGNASTTLDTGIFAEIKGANGNLSASIPVTEAVEGENGRMEAKVTTIWGFEKDTIDDAQSKETMDLKVSDELSDTAKLIVNNSVESGAVQYVNFEHDGDLPGTATVKVLKTAENSDTQNLKLYYINEQTGEVEEADIVDVAVETINGVDYYVVTVTHCSEYIISTGLTFKQETDEGKEDVSITAPSGSAGSTDRTNPNTSVKSGVSLMPAAAIVVIAAAAYILNKKRA